MKLISKVDKINIFSEAFLMLCENKNYNDISMREVSRNTPYSHTLLNKYFKNKGALLLFSYSRILDLHSDYFYKADTLGEIVCSLILSFKDRYNISATFSEAFNTDSELRGVIYEASRGFLKPHIVRVCKDVSYFEEYYSMIISLAFHPGLMLKCKESAPNMEKYMKLVGNININLNH